MFKRVLGFLIISSIVVSLTPSGPVFAATSEEKAEMLTFVKEYLLLESKNSGIFKLNNDENGGTRWFELYGILSEVRTKDQVHTVIVDADVFGYEDMHFLLYFDVAKKDGRWVMVNKRLGPRHNRQLTDQLSLPQ